MCVLRVVVGLDARGNHEGLSLFFCVYVFLYYNFVHGERYILCVCVFRVVVGLYARGDDEGLSCLVLCVCIIVL